MGSPNHLRFTLPATERLKLRKQIETLFQTGEAFSVYPLRVIYTITERGTHPSPLLAGFSVPKKRMKLAVQRNRIKRLIKEAWRLQKHLLVPELSAAQQLHIFFIFTGKEQPDYAQIYKSVQKAISALSTKYLRSDAPTG